MTLFRGPKFLFKMLSVRELVAGFTLETNEFNS